MRHFTIITAFLFLTTASFGQSFQRLSDETAEQFATRLKPDGSEIVHKIIETKWNDKPVIFAFYEGIYKLPKEKDPDQQAYVNIIATLFLQTGSNHYKKYSIDTLGSDGGDPEIGSVFFANADADSKKELALIIKWHQIHYDYGGDWYGTFFFKMPASEPNAIRLEFLKTLSESFYGCECDYRDGTRKKAKFKTADSVKAELKQRGFN